MYPDEYEKLCHGRLVATSIIKRRDQQLRKYLSGTQILRKAQELVDCELWECDHCLDINEVTKT